jgi:hypothetical protein
MNMFITRTELKSLQKLVLRNPTVYRDKIANAVQIFVNFQKTLT